MKSRQNGIPPPIESIAVGALAMTPGVKIKDILTKGISINYLIKENKNISGIQFFMPNMAHRKTIWINTSGE